MLHKEIGWHTRFEVAVGAVNSYEDATQMVTVLQTRSEVAVAA